MAAAETTRSLVAAAIARGGGERDVARALCAVPRGREAVALHALHQLAARDDLRTVEAAARALRVDVARVVDRPLGRRGYTALCVAAYHGAVACTKYLVSQGADVNYTNSHGEDLLGTLDAGERDAVAAAPDDHIFSRDRYRLCRRWIEDRRDFLARARARGPVDYLRRARPPRIAAALTILRWWRAARRARGPDRPGPAGPRRRRRRGRRR